ncbi:MAG: hypothetical protein HKO85_06445 [Xanthomonadales bacterium]|nr:hypothetical protein [Gammaproteobacteria bacterium]MBT8051114.1 hypothetical protein [Gammaproteobacteria bacterium]MBT8057020.1 hypothetical protein [Gammaproteobacteria bacterium]NNJ77707.1 hypothetical protein [Xanthomonadales bacterium]NNL04910.1 hypothetical protein [Xanthomonadales bacterium]
MKRITLSMTFLGFVFSAGLWAHHMAEGIISAELWEQIDDSLEDSNSQHNEMLSISSPDMTVVTDDETGIIFLESVVRVDFDESVPESDYVTLVEEFIDLFVLPETVAMNRVPAGTVIETPVEIDSRTLYITYEMEDDSIFPDGTDDFALVTTLEPIGRGNSQNAPAAPPSAPPYGNQNGG